MIRINPNVLKEGDRYAAMRLVIAFLQSNKMLDRARRKALVDTLPSMMLSKYHHDNLYRVLRGRLSVFSIDDAKFTTDKAKQSVVVSALVMLMEQYGDPIPEQFEPQTEHLRLLLELDDSEFAEVTRKASRVMQRQWEIVSRRKGKAAAGKSAGPRMKGQAPVQRSPALPGGLVAAGVLGGILGFGLPFMLPLAGFEFQAVPDTMHLSLVGDDVVVELVDQVDMDPLLVQEPIVDSTLDADPYYEGDEGYTDEELEMGYEDMMEEDEFW